MLGLTRGKPLHASNMAISVWTRLLDMVYSILYIEIVQPRQTPKIAIASRGSENKWAIANGSRLLQTIEIYNFYEISHKQIE